MDLIRVLTRDATVNVKLDDRKNPQGPTLVMTIHLADPHLNVILLGTSPSNLMPVTPGSAPLPEYLRSELADVIRTHDFRAEPLAMGSVGPHGYRMKQIAGPAGVYYAIMLMRVTGNSNG
jgi:hypothetical protein